MYYLISSVETMAVTPNDLLRYPRIPSACLTVEVASFWRATFFVRWFYFTSSSQLVDSMAVLRYISLLLLIVVSVSFVASDDDDDDSLRCLKVVIPDNVCAILYDDENCLHRPLIGWKKELGEGEEELGFRYRNDAESVIVKKGCTFRGYVNNNTTYIVYIYTYITLYAYHNAFP